MFKVAVALLTVQLLKESTQNAEKATCVSNQANQGQYFR